MRRQWLMLVGSGALGVLLTGCAAIPKGSVIFTHTPLLPTGTINAKAGLQILQDKRPGDEQRALKNISNVNEQLTSLLLQDFQQVKLFESLELMTDPARADITLRGEIRSLTWRSRWSPITFIPYLNLITFFGFPAGDNTGGVRIYLEAVNSRTGEVLARYEKSSGASRTYSIYQATDYRVSGGEETREALRAVFDELKLALWHDRALLTASSTSSGR